MSILSHIKNIVKNTIYWNYLKHLFIVHNQNKTYKICEGMINDYLDNSNIIYSSNIKNTDLLSSKHIIWIYWAQGFDNTIPEVVKICLDSIYKYENCNETKIVLLDDLNYKEYITLPNVIENNKKNYSLAHFSDILRLFLLTQYGGLWLDATVMLSRSIPAKYWDLDYFVFRRDAKESNKKYWENTFLYYFSWDNKFKVRMLNSIIFCKKGNNDLMLLLDILIQFWKAGTPLPDYFTFQILYEYLLITKLIDECPLESDCKPHYLQQYLNDENFNIANFDEILKLTPFHKLTYKNKDLATKLKSLMK